ncbi:aminotransferase class I/II-fold pyridoxal phosphate-dependent enzyme [Streptomyces sp. NPDC057950]|uniref:aminotransferase class I/II-fold pyridoxal phosphate-dependent enzyme n=1 Tax=Streptomyces sp. NPDC057950 TaxID=3346288 RepID=UPI0036F0CC1E
MGYVVGKKYGFTGHGAVEIAASIEQAIGQGVLAPGTTLPPHRELAADLAVNPNTVAAAYRRLRDRGVIETGGRRGSWVRPRPATTVRDALLPHMPPGVRDVSTGNPDTALLPALGPALASAAALHATQPALYGQAPLNRELEQLARDSFDMDGVPEGPVGLTSGALDAIERALVAHLRPGDTVAVEDPGWASLFDLLPGLGLQPTPVPVDDEGPVPHHVEAALRQGAQALIVTNRGQNPTGAALSTTRADELRAVLSDYPKTLVVEDDHAFGLSELPLHTLGGSTRHWIVVRSTAKAYGPDLRLAALTGDPVTVDRIGGRHRLGPGWISHLLQNTVTHLWRTQSLDTRAVSASYAARRDGLVQMLADRGVLAHGRSGINVWIPVLDETATVTRLLQSGWAVAPGARFRLRCAPGVRVTISPLSLQDLPGLADAITEAVRPQHIVRYG